MNDSQEDQATHRIQDEEGQSGRTSLTIAKCVWAFVFIAVLAYYALYWISWVALFFALMLLVQLMKIVPIVAALGVYFGFKETEAQGERDARIGMVLNAVAFVVGAIFLIAL
jgi:hypothetical protein